MDPVTDIMIAEQIAELAIKLGEDVAVAINQAIALHRPDLTAEAPPEDQEKAILDIVDTQIKAKFPGA